MRAYYDFIMAPSFARHVLLVAGGLLFARLVRAQSAGGASGIATAVGSAREPAALTTAGVSLRTPACMAPERATGEESCRNSLWRIAVAPTQFKSRVNIRPQSPGQERTSGR